MNRTILTMLALASISLLPLGSLSAAEVDLTADVDLAGGANLGSIAPSGGDGTPGDPYQYVFTASGGGLNLDAYRLLSSDGSCFTLYTNGESVTGTGAESINTYRGAGAGLTSGDVRIYGGGAGDISMGGVDAHAISNSGSSGARADAGDVNLGGSVSKVGNVRVDYIYSYAGVLDSSTLRRGYGGNVGIYSTGNVLIESSGGTAGNILTHAYTYGAGDVTVMHEGAFRANDIQAWVYSHWSGGSMAPGTVTLNGDAGNDGSLGSFEVHDIVSAAKYINYGGAAGSISISNYSSVHISGVVEAYHNSNYSGSNDGGNLSITGIAGNIDIDGSINLDSTNASATDGQLHLEATNFGYITLASLDLTKISIARIDSDTGTTVSGGVLGFDISGSQTALRAPTGEVINYDPFLADNAYLGFGTYQLVNLDNSGVGGYLAPSLTARTWAGDTAGVWSSAAFDGAGNEAPTSAAQLAVFDDTASSTTVSVEAASPGPTVGAIRLAGSSSYSINDGGGTINLDASGGAQLIVSASDGVDHTISAPIDLAGDTQLQALYAGSGMTISGAISGSAAVNKTGPGKVTLSSVSSSYSGGTTVSSGVLLVGADVAASGNSPLGTGSIDLAGGALGAGGSYTVYRDVALSADSNLGGAGNSWITVAGDISGAHNLGIIGDGFVSLTGNNTHASTSVDGGTLVVAGGSFSGPITVNSGNFGFTAPATVGVVNVEGGTMDVQATADVDELNANGGAVTLSADLNVATVNVVGGTISGSGSNALVVSNTMNIGGTGFTISGGDTFRVQGTTDASGPGHIVLNGGTLTVGGAATPENPVAFYSFDDSGNLGNDDSGNGHTLSIYGNSAYSGSGAIGGAVTLDGAGDYLRADSVATAVNDGDLTALAWVNTSSTSPQQFALGLNSSGGNNLFMAGHQSGDTTYSLYDNGASGWKDSNQVVVDGTWHQIGFVLDNAGNKTSLIVDGTIYSPYTSSSTFGSGDSFAIGMELDGASAGDYWNGLVDEVFIYARQLTTDEVLALYNAGVGGGYPSSVTLLNDLSGVGSIAGSIDIAGTLSPGNSPGTISVAGNVTLLDGSVYEADPGDLLAVDGDLTIEDGAVIRLLGGAENILLFTYTGDATIGNVVFDESAPYYSPSLALLDDGNGNVFVTGAAVPEPATLLLLGLGGAAFIAVRRRRSR